MQFPSVSEIIISKPKKLMNTFLASMHYKSKKLPLRFAVDSAMCIPISSDVVLVKNKNFMDFVADLNEHIISCVKSNCVEWFNNNMNLELIEEYYVNPLKYDKIYGSVVKLKHDEGKLEKGKKNIIIDVVGLRFLKQKFSIEWTISSIEDVSDKIEFQSVDTDSIFSSDLDDIPEPDPEELLEMKDKYNLLLTNISISIDDEHAKHKEVIKQLDAKKKLLVGIKDKIAEVQNVNDFYEISEAIQNIQS
uniref:Uncharacterized protein n=1 Tax=viral metagenome TaxID=1070528 RepID=A0A6C0BED8_9ZZZZ